MPAVGLEPTNSNESGFTIRRNCRYAILAFLSFLLDLNQRPSACKADALPTELRKDIVTPSGLEPETPSLKVRCSKPIELRSHIVTPEGLEPPLSGPKPLVLPLDERVIYGW